MRKQLSDEQDAMRIKMQAAARRLSEQNEAAICNMWKTNGITQKMLARMYGLSQPSIHQVLKRAGLTRKNIGPAEDRFCKQCNAPVKVRGHRRSNFNTFCSKVCYWKYLYNPNYRRNIWGNIQARRIVKEYFDLQPGNIVDHQDGDSNNNKLNNLRVYASQADHMAMHRGRGAKPIWIGANPHKSSSKQKT